jgi:hypothetical protein
MTKIKLLGLENARDEESFSSDNTLQLDLLFLFGDGLLLDQKIIVYYLVGLLGKREMEKGTPIDRTGLESRVGFFILDNATAVNVE